MARHVCGMVMLVLWAAVAVGCKSGADTSPRGLDSMLSRNASNGPQTSAAVNMPSLPSSGSTNLADATSTSGDYQVPNTYPQSDSAMGGFRGTLQQTASSIKDAMTIRPKVIPANDPTSLAYDPGPLRPDLYVAAAAVLEQQNRTTDAAEKYKQALSVDANHRPALIGLARLRHRQGDAAGAIQLYQTALQTYPDDAVLLNDVALCYARTEQSDRALAALQRAVELNPSSTLYRNNMAAVLVEANRSAEAVPLLAQTYGTAVAYYNVGYLLHQRGEDQAAVDHFSAALEVNPSLMPARSMLNRLAPQLGERPMRSRLPDTRQQPSAALTPNSSLRDGSVDPSTDTLGTSPAAWTISDNENEAPNVVPSVGTRVFDAEVLPASHVAPSQEFEESTPEWSDNAQARPDSLNLLSRPILSVGQHGPGQLVPPVPQSVKQPVQTEFLPTQLPQPE